MFDLTAVTAIATVLLFVATVLLFFATWRAATAAKQNADIAAREFRLRSRPLVALQWKVTPSAPDGALFLSAKVTEVAGISTTLHSMEASATPVVDPPAPACVVRQEPNVVLRGDAASFSTFLKILVPLWMVSNDPPEWVRRIRRGYSPSRKSRCEGGDLGGRGRG